MKRKKSKKKNTSRKPPLSFVDKCIYYSAIVLSFIGTLFFIYSLIDIQRLWIFRDPTVVAYKEHASFLLLLPLVGYVGMSALIFFCVQLSDKKPIFGNATISYGQIPWDKDCFPLFDPRRKTVTVRPSKRKLNKKLWITWFIGLLVVLMIAPFGFWGRDCLCYDNSVISYNAINRPTGNSYSKSDFSHLTIRANYVTLYKGGSYWEYGMNIEMSDGKEFYFSNRKFNRQDIALKKMLEIKQLFSSDEITVYRAENVDKVASYIGLSDEQTQLLHDLFSF